MACQSPKQGTSSVNRKATESTSKPNPEEIFGVIGSLGQKPKEILAHLDSLTNGEAEEHQLVDMDTLFGVESDEAEKIEPESNTEKVWSPSTL